MIAFSGYDTIFLSELKKREGNFYGGTGRTENDDVAGAGADGAVAASGRRGGRADRKQETAIGEDCVVGGCV